MRPWRGAPDKVRTGTTQPLSQPFREPRPLRCCRVAIEQLRREVLHDVSGRVGRRWRGRAVSALNAPVRAPAALATADVPRDSFAGPLATAALQRRHPARPCRATRSGACGRRARTPSNGAAGVVDVRRHADGGRWPSAESSEYRLLPHAESVLSCNTARGVTASPRCRPPAVQSLTHLASSQQAIRRHLHKADREGESRRTGGEASTGRGPRAQPPLIEAEQSAASAVVEHRQAGPGQRRGERGQTGKQRPERLSRAVKQRGASKAELKGCERGGAAQAQRSSPAQPSHSGG